MKIQDTLTSRLLLAAAGVMTLLIAAITWNGVSLKNTALEEAGLSAARGALQEAQNARDFYAREIVPKAAGKGLSASHDFKGQEDHIPVPATLIGALSENDTHGIALRLYSRLPFRFRGTARLDGFEDEALAWLEKNPQGEFHRIEWRHGAPLMRLAKADVMANESCVSCHNSHPDSPRHDWKLGDVRGALEVTLPLTSMAQQINTKFQIAALIMATCLVLGAAIFLWLARSLNRPLAAVTAAAEYAALHDDFSQAIPETGPRETLRVGQALNLLLQKFREVIGKTRLSSDDIAGASRLLSSASSQVALGSTTQAEASSSVAATVEETSVSISETNANAQNASERVGKTRSDVAQALGIMNETVESVNAIAALIRNSSVSVEQLESSSKKIGGIIQVIKEIADQTNLLALNAAIEAARAGDQGRGFAVVADEVRKLAERTSRATEEIAGLISEIQGRISGSVDSMQRANGQAAHSLDLVGSTQLALQGVDHDSEQVALNVHSIALALKEQDNAVQQVAMNIEKIAQMAEESNSAASSASETAARLDALSGQLHAAVMSFKV